MQNESLWTRLKRARVFQVVVVYLGASWAVLQVAQLLHESLGLPDWVVPVALLLLIIGLLVILATAWVQSLPATKAAAETGTLPGAWEIAPRGLLQALREGELPHLTWGRAILGGAFALWLLFGFAGLYVVVKNRGQAFAPAELAADVAGEGIAVVPFTVRGEGTDVWREGMVEVFAISLDDVGGYRTIDSRTLMARWNEAVPKGSDADLATTREVARRAGARFVMTGSAVSLGSDVRLAAELVDVATGRNVGRGQVQGSADSILALADRLSIEVIGALLREGDSEILTSHQAASLTTSSLSALKSYLEAESHYRNADFVPAVEAYERALAADSNFVLAHYRLAEAYGWMEDMGSDRAEEHYLAVERLIDGLRPRDRAIVEGNAALVRGDLTRIEEVRRTTEKYPDDPEAWFLLGEYYVHAGGQLLASVAETRRVIDKAVELDPNFGPYYIHAIEYAIIDGDSAKSREYLDRYSAIAPLGYAPYLALANDLFRGDSLRQASARAALDTVPDRTLFRVWAEFDWRVGRPAVQQVVLEEAESRGLPGGVINVNPFSGGMIQEDLARAARPGAPPLGLMMSRYEAARFAGAGTVESMDLAACGELATVNPHCAIEVAAWHIEKDDPKAALDVASSLRGTDGSLRAVGDSARADLHARAAALIAAYALVPTEGTAAAIRALEALQGKRAESIDLWARIWLAELHEGAGSDREAMLYYQSLYGSPVRAWADYRLGALHERLGQEDEAAESYGAFLQAWEEADEDLPWLADARKRLDGLISRGG